jgi:putative hydrolase of the HAD superfamily
MAWVMFGYRGVICRWPSEQAMATLAGAAGTSVRRFADAYWQLRPAYDRAELDAAGYWQEVGRRAGRGQVYGEAEVAELTRLDTDSWLHLEAGTVALVEELAAAGHRLAILANAPVNTAEAIAGLPVTRHFEHLVFSCQLKKAKPAADCFTAALAVLRAAAAEVIFIDDQQDSITAAVTLGMRSVRFTGPGQARALLADLLARHQQ